MEPLASKTKEIIKLDTGRLVVSVDPGDKHVGVAIWGHDPQQGWTCEAAQEMTVPEFVSMLETGLKLGGIGCVVYEIFQLYGDKAQAQTGSEFETSQLIGVIKYLVSKAPELWPDPGPVQIFKQPAGIKTPTIGILRRKKVKSMAKSMKADPDGHGFDAELHGYHFFGQHDLPLHYQK